MLAMMWKKGNPSTHWYKCKLIQPLWNTVWRVLKKIENRTTIRFTNSIPGVMLKKMKTSIQKEIWTPMLIAALFTIAKMWKQPSCLSTTDEWIKWCDECVCVCVCVCVYVLTHNGIQLGHKKEWNFAIFKKWMGLEDTILSKVHQTENEKHCMLSCICRIYKINEWI